jgi:uncharacterized protein
MLLTDELFLYYQRCNRRAFLDVYGDLSQRDPPSDYLLKLRQDSRSRQQQVLEGQIYDQPRYPSGDCKAGAKATLSLMQQGVERIYRGVLLCEGSAEVTLVSQPDLLIRRPGQSQLGDWTYELVEIKLGKRPKLEYQIVAAFHAQVLARVQGTWPTAWLLLRERDPYAVNLDLILPQMQDLVLECTQMLTQAQEPEVFIARSRCNLCQWFNHCYAIARQEEHLSLLPGVTPSRYTHLQNLNLTTAEALAGSNSTTLERLPGFGGEIAVRLVRQAQAVVQNQALLVIQPSLVTSTVSTAATANKANKNLLLPILPTASVELYFDIEAEPERNLVYLHGVLVIDHTNRSEQFHPFLADSVEREESIWQQFLELVCTYPDAPIFHFCPYEVQTVRRLGQLYKTPPHQVQQLVTRFVDLHAWVTQTVTLPVESYALKQIARWLGFQWRDPAANGAQAIYWYVRWLETGDRTFLNSILRYNEDDCRATYHVKTWLSEFLQD